MTAKQDFLLQNGISLPKAKVTPVKTKQFFLLKDIDAKTHKTTRGQRKK